MLLHKKKIFLDWLKDSRFLGKGATILCEPNNELIELYKKGELNKFFSFISVMEDKSVEDIKKDFKVIFVENGENNYLCGLVIYNPIKETTVEKINDKFIKQTQEYVQRALDKDWIDILFEIKDYKLSFADMLNLIGESGYKISQNLNRTRAYISDIKTGKNRFTITAYYDFTTHYPLLPWDRFLRDEYERIIEGVKK